MATLKPIKARTLTRKAAYYQLCRIMAKQVRIGKFYGRELYQTMQRPAVKLFAQLAVKKYFNRGEDTAKVKRDMVVMYQALLVMTPILQRIPRSLHIDQHRGHVLSWLRIYAGGNAKRRFVTVKEVEREHNPTILTKRLETLGIHDRTFTKVLVALFRAYYWRDTVAGSLARILFDPIMLDIPRDRHALRIGNRIYALHKDGSAKSCNMNKSPFVIFDYSVSYDMAATRNKLTICLSPVAVAMFKKTIRSVMKLQGSPKYKAGEIEKSIDKFTDRAKWAKDDQTTIIELRRWLWQTMQPLNTGAVTEDFKYIPNILLNKWMQKRTRTTGLIRARSNILYDLSSLDLDVFMNFLTPYREV